VHIVPKKKFEVGYVFPEADESDTQFWKDVLAWLKKLGLIQSYRRNNVTNPEYLVVGDYIVVYDWIITNLFGHTRFVLTTSKTIKRYNWRGFYHPDIVIWYKKRYKKIFKL